MRRIHIDSSKGRPTSTATGGLLYEAEQHTAAIQAEPAMLCPCCGELASDFSGGSTSPDRVPPFPLGEFKYSTMTYCVEPCGCRVNEYWACGFAEELNRRKSGLKPNAIAALPNDAKEEKVAYLSSTLAELYALRDQNEPDVATDGINIFGTNQRAQQRQQAKSDIEYWINVVGDQIQRLCPSANNRRETGTYGRNIYRVANGTVSRIPQYAGQLPCGTIDEDTERVVSTLVQSNAELPQLERTRNGQWSVRYGDLYQVFRTQNEAMEASLRLIRGAGMTPILSTKQAPLSTTPKVVASPIPVSKPEPIDKTVRKRRTIRKIEE